MRYVMCYAPVRTFLYVVSYINFGFIILMTVLDKHDGLLYIVNLLLTEDGIEFLEFIDKM